MSHALQRPSPTAAQVHRSLAVLGGCLWLTVSGWLLLLLGPEVFPHGWHAVAMAAAPPLIPVILTILVAFFGWSPGALAAALGIVAWLATPWLLAARYPHSTALLWWARIALISYFAVAWFGMGLSA